jgi:hypothetical protein
LLTRQGPEAGLSIATVRVGSPVDLDSAFAELSRYRPGALFVLPDNSLLGLADTALAQRVPTFGNLNLPFAQAGAVNSGQPDSTGRSPNCSAEGGSLHAMARAG